MTRDAVRHHLEQPLLRRAADAVAQRGLDTQDAIVGVLRLLGGTGQPFEQCALEHLHRRRAIKQQRA